MKKILFFIVFAFLANQIFSQELQDTQENKEIEKIEEIEKVEVGNKPNIFFDEGIALACVNRLQEQEERSNFNWKDSLIGAYFTVHINDFFTFDVLSRTEVFYPFLHTFNGMEVFSKQTILYAFDELVGIDYKLKKFKYFTLNVVPGVHLMYQLTDEYHLFYFGGGLIIGAELPIAKNWTLLADGTFTCDYPNLGSNSLVQPFYFSWQWQTSLGVRYSKKKQNAYSYIK